MKRPKPIRVGDLVARAIRPPSKSDPRWYWRCEQQRNGERTTLLAGRFDRDDVAAALLDASRTAPVERLATLDELLRGWTAWVAQRAAAGQVTERTLRAYRGRRRTLIAEWGDHQLAPVQRLELHVERSAFRSLRDRKPATVAAWVDAIRAAWSWGRRQGLVEERALRLPAVRADRTPKPPVPLDELDAVLDELPAGDVRDAVELLRETGIRAGALSGLKVSSVDPRRRQLRVEHKGAPRWVPLTDRAAAALRPRLLASGPEPLFPGLQGARAVTNINDAIGRACEALRLRRFTTHAIRRRVAVDLVRAGTPLHVYASIMGHSVAVAARHYLEVGEEDRAAAAAALQARDATRPRRRSPSRG